MPRDGFHSEWITIGKHRVLLEARASFPDEDHRFIATLVAKFLDHNSEHAGLVKVFFDDKACVYSIEAATTDPAEKELEDPITQLVQSVYGTGNYLCDMTVVQKGDELSDHYHHMEHLSVSAGVAIDRWAK
ncbi:hypothetical protein [Pseudomonas chlororaphis]|uniref:hypothetical protein n=1 Tax=Pseudomonas chlororaphis TaxID=587753 RepID=UPI000F58491C|nr:hypothetical protein [Pseudomonas chlororaphis]